MTFLRLVLASLRFHARSHLGVLLGAAVGSAALIGALVVGSSVRGTLRTRAAERLGGVELALDSGDRLFRVDLAKSFGGRPVDLGVEQGNRRLVWGEGFPLMPAAAGVLRLRGTVSRQDGTARALEVGIHGVTSNFWSFSPRSMGVQKALSASGQGRAESLALLQEMRSWERPLPGRVRVNRALASQLRVSPGDTLILRFPKPSALSQDAVLSPRNEASAALRVVVEDVVDGAAFGDLALSAGARPALNAFVPLEDLGRAAGVTNRVNLLLARTGVVEMPPGDWRSRFLTWSTAAGPARRLWLGLARFLAVQPASPAVVADQAERQLTQSWKLEDGQVETRVLEAVPGRPDMVEVATPRVFLDPAVVAAATSPDPRLPRPDREERGWLTNGVRVLTYLANGLRAGERLTPYSMVSAAGPPYTPQDLAQDEIVITDWLASDLAVGVGGTVEMTYFDPGAGARLLERTNVFRVRAVVPLAGWHGDRSLMPEFPGLAKAESTRDWDAGFPLAHRIRDQDEAYWKAHRGTPKAWVSAGAGRAMWGNRFGDTTAVRHRVPAGTDPDAFRGKLEANLRAALQPGDVGLTFQRVREQAMRAASSGQDFGGLFIGFSFFLVLAALLLMALLFQFGLEQRLPEVGTLLALGFRPQVVRKLWLGEGIGLAALGAFVGALGGVVYARGLILGLTTLWRDAVGGASLELHVGLGTLLGGWGASVAVCGLALFLTLRRQFHRPVRDLLAGEVYSTPASGAAASRSLPRRPSRALWMGVGSWAGAVVLTGWALAQGGAADPGVFFGAGSLVLVGGLAILAARLAHLGRAGAGGGGLPGLGTLAVRGTARRASRSVTTAALLASGTFLVASLGAFRMDAQRGAWDRGSGTGGFAWIGETSLPVSQDLNTPGGLEAFGLGAKELPGLAFVGFRVRDGDDASCLNLNRAQRPRLLGVRPGDLAGRGAFTFVQEAEGAGAGKGHGWDRLTLPTGGVVAVADDGVPEYPAIGDAASIQWALGSRVGGLLEMKDERGRPFRLRLVGGVANSILQGSLVVDVAVFERLYPGESGQRWFLIDGPREGQEALAARLSRAMEDVGLELVPAAARLAQFHAVQNTYLSTFQVLGGLGLLLGSAGLGVVVLRNVLERRGELALLTAVGFPRPTVAGLILWEHSLLLGAGLGLGVLAAGVAVLPALTGAGAGRPPLSLAWTLLGVLLLGLGTTWAATRGATRGRLLDALRGE